MNVGDIISYKAKTQNFEQHARIGGFMTNDLGYDIIHLHNIYTGKYYGNITPNLLCTTTNKTVISIIREEKLEKLISDFDWERRYYTDYEGASKKCILIKKYNDNRTINEISRS